jgi:uncharacterized protein
VKSKMRSMTALLSPTPTTAALPQRRFGKTDEPVPVVGLGTGPGGIGMQDDEAIPLYHAAIDRGITYIDTAPGYKRAHAQLGEILPTRRDEVFLATKCFAGTAKEAVEIHEQSLRDLRTERSDLLYAHCIGSFEPEDLMSPTGVFAGLRELQRRGLTRFIGFTAHHLTRKSEVLLQKVVSGDLQIDCVMLAMNFADRHTYGFEDRILPLAEKLDLGVACMKVFCGAKDMSYEANRCSHLEQQHALAFRYALGLPGVAVAVIGMNTVEQVEQNVRWARNYEPLTAEEQERLADEGKALAAEWGPRFGDPD